MAQALITVANYQFLPEAEAARMHLETEGIPTFLADAETVNMDWFLGNAIGYIKLQVPATRAEEALAARERMRGQRNERPVTASDLAGPPLCLACGAPLPVARSPCPACGWSYAGEGASAPEGQAPAGEEEPSAQEEATSFMDTMRSLKRPVLLLFLAPVFVMLGVLVLALLAWLLEAGVR